MLDGPIHKGIFPYVRSLPRTPNFPIMIYPAQVVWPFQSVTYFLMMKERSERKTKLEKKNYEEITGKRKIE